jgi:hypothetical protein
VGWYDGPYDLIRFASRRLGRHREAEEAERKYARAKARRLAVSSQAGEIGAGPVGVAAGAAAGEADRRPQLQGTGPRVAVLGPICPWKKSSGRFSTDENLRFSRTLRGRDRIPAFPAVWLSTAC